MNNSYWIKKTVDFNNCIKKGKKINSKSYRLYFINNRFNNYRIGISVSKKISKLSVVRNKIKRQIKSFFYTHKIKLNSKVDLVIVVSKNYDLNTYLNNLDELANKIRFLNKI